MSRPRTDEHDGTNKPDPAPLGPPHDVTSPPAPVHPPSTDGNLGAGWASGRLLTGLRTSGSPEGIWVDVEGHGSKPLSPNSKPGPNNLALLACMAVAGRLTISYHENASGQIDQIRI